MYGYIDSNGNKHLLSGQQDIPQYTMEQYTTLSVKPDIWVCTNYDSYYGLIDYSEVEKVVGSWIDGKPLYQKTVSCGALPNNSTKNTAHNISNIKKIVEIKGYATNGSTFVPFPYINGTNSNVVAGIYANSLNVIITTGSVDLSGYTESYVTLRYTKTTD